MRNILYGLVVAIFVGILAAMFVHDREQKQAFAEKQENIAREEVQESRQRRAAGEEIYNQLLIDLADGPQGFVCWGDSQAVGNRKGSLAESFSEKLNDTFFYKLNRAFMNEAQLYYAGSISIPVINMGTTKEGLPEILARTGAHKMVTGEDFSMPSSSADFERRNITLADEDGNTLIFAEQPYALFGETVIDGIQGRLYTGTGYYDSTHSKLASGRDRRGQKYTVPAGTTVETAGATEYRTYYPILFFSEYDEVESAQFIDDMREIISAYGEPDHYMILCVTDEGSAWDIALSREFGSYYLRHSKSVEDMTVEDYDALAQQLFSAMESQGIFLEIADAVKDAYEQLQNLRVGD